MYEEVRTYGSAHIELSHRHPQSAPCQAPHPWGETSTLALGDPLLFGELD